MTIIDYNTSITFKNGNYGISMTKPVTSNEYKFITTLSEIDTT